MAQAQALWPNLTPRRVQAMVDASAPYTHALANRRYGDMLLVVREDRVVEVLSEAAFASEMVEAICPDCDGDGGRCDTCNQTGRVKLTRLELADLAH